jgi:hypothetical protein
VIQPGLPVCIVGLLAIAHTLKNDKGMRKEKRNTKDWNFLSNLRPHTESRRFANGREVSSFSWSSRSPFLPFGRSDWFAVVDV